MSTADDIRQRFQAEMKDREARAERMACLIWIGVISATYLAFWLNRANWAPVLVQYISVLVSVMLPAFIVLFVIIQRGHFHPGLTFVNSFLQVTLVSSAIYFDNLVYGAQYALSSMPPLAYALVIGVTAFRMRPAMGVFAGTLAAAQFVGLYALMRLTESGLSADVVEATPSLGWPVMIMKVVLLLAMGIACSVTAIRLRDELQNFVLSAQTEMRLEKSLGRYVSSEVASQLVNQESGEIPTRGTEAVVMFGDIRDFTRYSNSHDPEQVASFLNQFFDRVNLAIEAEGGILNKFLGDGWLAVFGLFDELETANERATRAAIRILNECDQTLAAEGLGIGIALNRGPVVAGEIGSTGRCEYTVIGNSVNIAARLEALNRKLGSRLLVTEDFAAALPIGLVEPSDRGQHDIRGIADPIQLIELIPVIS